MGIGYRPFRPRQMETQCQPPSETAVAGLQESARAREPDFAKTHQQAHTVWTQWRNVVGRNGKCAPSAPADRSISLGTSLWQTGACY
jgi:hypothetical protein